MFARSQKIVEIKARLGILERPAALKNRLTSGFGSKTATFGSLLCCINSVLASCSNPAPKSEIEVFFQRHPERRILGLSNCDQHLRFPVRFESAAIKILNSDEDFPKTSIIVDGLRSQETFIVVGSMSVDRPEASGYVSHGLVQCGTGPKYDGILFIDE